jgi:hypothetical protein
LSCGPWTKKGLPSHPKLMALGPPTTSVWSVGAAKPRAGPSPRPARTRARRRPAAGPAPEAPRSVWPGRRRGTSWRSRPRGVCP